MKELLEFITTYRWQLIIMFFVANILFRIGIRLQKKYKRAQNVDGDDYYTREEIISKLQQ